MKSPRRIKQLAVVMAAAMTATVLNACGLGTAGGYIPSAKLAGDVQDVDLSNATISFGGKNYTEQLIVSKMAVILLSAAGASVKDLSNIPGSTELRQAMVKGDLDATFDYTGNAWISYFGHTDPIPDPQQQWESVRDADKERGFTWLPQAPMNDTYALAVTQQTAEHYNIHSLADINNMPKDERNYCGGSEFLARNDGLLPMLEAYGVDMPTGNQKKAMDAGATYEATANGTCQFGTVYTTDGRIPYLNLQVLDDPKQFFPKYNMAPSIRTEVYEKYPQLAELFAPLMKTLDNSTMQRLNAEVDVEGKDYTEVAWDYLQEKGWVTSK